MPGFRDREGQDGLQTKQLMVLSRLAGLVVLLVVTIFLAWAGANLIEALYLSVVLMTSLMYLAYEMRLHRKV
jgi:hypothetical protein